MDVHTRLARHLLVDGYRLVLDLELSHGSWLVDARDGRRYLDFYTFFASAPLGVNPPFDPDHARLLGQVARNKPANPDIYTEHLADFVDTFVRVLGDPDLPHLFFVEGGALAVENALKTAFDWKSRRNEAAGRSRDLGTKVMHLTKAFHGRSGYTLSLTNTEPGKTDRFPKFDWPRIDVPAIHFGDVEAAEERALAQARAAFERHPHDIACFIAEPIQGEGGDNHMRSEFLQAMQRLCHEHDALFVLDEVQTGGGTTGTPWAYQQLGLAPDIVAFAKKVQVGGIMAGRRVDEVPGNVFQQSGRINSTWGGGLVDMVRSRGLLEIIERDGLIARAATVGGVLLERLSKLEAERPQSLSNVRGRGMMCAFDLPDQATRDALVTRLREEHGVLVLPCGPTSVRLRPALNIPEADLDLGLAALSAAL
ncbi:Probable L-lysine-epsilon aminotransferase (L-lysine aminotransferase) (Lysine 6-aminotransferase) [[Actinomadura] parvosata subsp. kistnae]|uniref:L-lysine-epsilon aminotransferase n=1 Tax=[Actinomadura] parvosata subsp. kistnae TaxID=1909395 RepID=A0A1V0AGM5_9ACTN|nr:L-lysine 6-transaminase [Nonomuraea sp. ATCC 55076]AQZ69343.1 L-lysine 6-transaminase [Nonomuraea sp. ATCC 55076]SPL92021.1 Probable L-lysine-epsilon aminotransferase (L-lysine aminotransferase) (Lysine 6-aminotransferase) [Actinomadura parvosata subsp. kistnae]